MAALALAVLGIALLDSLNPSLIVADVYLTLGPHPFRRTLGFGIAAFVVTLAGGLAIALGLGDLVLSVLPKLSHTVKWDVLTGVGVLLICAGAVVWWRGDALTAREPSARGKPREGSSAVVLGAGIAGVELLTAFPYFAAIAMILGASVSFTGKVSLLVLYNVIYVLPLIVIVIVCAVMGEKGARVLTPVSDWIAMHWPTVVAPVAVTAGAALTTYGILQLT